MSPALTDVAIAPLPIERFQSVLDDDGYRSLLALRDEASVLLRGRAVWCVNSTARGGGVAEMLRSLLAYTRGAGVDTRWVVIGGTPEFFAITKRIHNRLHGVARRRRRAGAGRARRLRRGARRCGRRARAARPARATS